MLFAEVAVVAGEFHLPFILVIVVILGGIVGRHGVLAPLFCALVVHFFRHLFVSMGTMMHMTDETLRGFIARGSIF